MATIIEMMESERGVQCERKDILNLLSRSAISDMAEVRAIIQGPDLDGEVDDFVDDSGTVIVRNIVWVVRRALKMFSFCPFVLSVDTTFRTNRYRRSLLLFTGVDTAGLTVILGGAIMQDDTRESFVWAFSQLKRFLGPSVASRLQVVISDQEGAERIALRKVFDGPGVLHRLCLFHLLQRLTGSVKGSLRKRWYENLMEAVGRFPYLATDEELTEGWRQLLETSDEDGRKVYEKPKVKKAVARFMAEKEHWAHSFVRGYANLGVTTTGRSESINSVLKRMAKSNSKVSLIMRVTREIHDAYYRKRTLLDERMSSMVPTEEPKSVRFVARGLVSPYFYNHYLEQEILAAEEQMQRRGEECTWSFVRGEAIGSFEFDVHEATYAAKYQVTLAEGRAAKCSCSHHTMSLLICRHILFVLMRLQVPLQPLHLLPFWLLTPRGEIEAPQEAFEDTHRAVVNLSSTSDPAPPGPADERRQRRRNRDSQRDDMETEYSYLYSDLKQAYNATEGDLDGIKRLRQLLKDFTRALNPPGPAVSLNGERIPNSRERGAPRRAHSDGASAAAQRSDVHDTRRADGDAGEHGAEVGPGDGEGLEDEQESDSSSSEEDRSSNSESEEKVDPDLEVDDEHHSPRVRKCGICRTAGHNSRTCPKAKRRKKQ
jgi:hypothetical protein